MLSMGCILVAVLCSLHGSQTGSPPAVALWLLAADFLAAVPICTLCAHKIHLTEWSLGTEFVPVLFLFPAPKLCA
jgi:hypothetical protein